MICRRSKQEAVLLSLSRCEHTEVGSTARHQGNEGAINALWVGLEDSQGCHLG